jgi:hypothetical protein
VNDDDLPAVISGTRRKAQELADGTLRVMVDIDPRFKADFHRLVHHIDTPCAIAPLAMDFERIEKEEKEKKKVGPLCRLAAMWCKGEQFREWFGMRFDLGELDEEETADSLRSFLGVRSRKDIDHDPVASERFQKLVREPYMAWSRGRA